MLAELLARGAAVDGVTTMTGSTALVYAAMHGELECARLLLDKGADANAKNKARAVQRARAPARRVRLCA